MMSWSERYVKLPVVLFNSRTAEITGNQDSDTLDSYMMLNPFEISYYRPCVDMENGDITDETLVHMRSGEDLLVKLHISDFEKQVNAFYK